MLVLLAEIGSLDEKLANGSWKFFKIVAIAFDFVHHLVLVVVKWVLQKHVEHRAKYLCCLMIDWKIVLENFLDFYLFLMIIFNRFMIVIVKLNIKMYIEDSLKCIWVV